MYVLLLFAFINNVHCEWACGENYTIHWGVLTSPNYPYNYPPNQDCRWTISTYRDTHISLAFSDFNVEYSTSCYRDSVSIVDGLTNKSLYDKQCGYSLPDPVVSSGNVVIVHFTSSSTQQRRGFQLNWRVSDRYTLQPESLSWHEASARCIDEGGHLPTLNQLSTKAIQHIVESNGTREMWSGKYFTPWAWLKGCFETNSTVMASFKYTKFKNNQMMVCLNHCKNWNYFGLQDTQCICLDNVEGTLVRTKDKCRETCPGNNDERCGGDSSITIYMNDICYTQSSEWNGTISKPAFGLGYTCQHWATNIPHRNNYTEDYRYPDGTVQNASNYCRDPSRHGRPWCYTTDPNKQYHWCNIPHCLEKTTDDRMYPCMTFKWTHNGLVSKQTPCENKNQYLCSSVDASDHTWYLYHGDNEAAWQEARYNCIDTRWSLIDFYATNTMQLDVTYWTGYSRNFTHVMEVEPRHSPTDCFKLVLETGETTEKGTKCVEKKPYICQHAAIVCGEDIHSNNGNITSPNYPDVYYPLLNCVWRLNVATDKNISLALEFDIEKSYNCQNDYIKIYEGNSTMKMDLLASNLCGKNITTVRSATETVTIIFVSDLTVNSSGFIAKWEAVPVSTTSTKPTTADSFTPDKTSGTDQQRDTLTGGAVAGIVIGLLVLVAVVVIVVFLYRRLKGSSKRTPTCVNEPGVYLDLDDTTREVTTGDSNYAQLQPQLNSNNQDDEQSTNKSQNSIYEQSQPGINEQPQSASRNSGYEQPQNIPRTPIDMEVDTPGDNYDQLQSRPKSSGYELLHSGPNSSGYEKPQYEPRSSGYEQPQNISKTPIYIEFKTPCEQPESGPTSSGYKELQSGPRSSEYEEPEKPRANGKQT